ncbi:hypothetical protein M3Y99_01119500 [Aphelenchoides fujianensis]|nr:hypothetical protein M3Y99_01119500 [Aphelenchoides fujianensis]
MLRNDRMRVRSLMLAQFQRGADEERAFARVCLEFGPKATTRKTLEKWFEKFRRGDTSLADRRKGRRLGGRQALSADRFAAVQRAFCGRMESSLVFEKFVYDGRFMVLPFQPSVRMVDLFHMKEMPLNFELQPPARMVVNLKEFRLVDVRRAFFRLKYEGGGANSSEEEYWKHVVNAGDDPSLLHYVVAQKVDGTFRDFYQCIRLKGEQFEIKERVELPEKLHEPFLFHNGHLFAFEECAERFGWPEFRKLLKISPATGHAVELPTSGWSQENEKRPTSQLWVGTTLIVRCEPEVDGEFVHRLWAFDLRSLQWRQFEWDFGDELPFLYSDEENLLFVHGYKSGREKDSLYRFAINCPDRLSAIAWRFVRRRADFDPGFLAYALKQLPKNSPIRCPFSFANQ